MKIVFLGTPDFAVESLRRLWEEKLDICAVVTMPDKRAGRGHKLLESPVKQFAVEKGIKVLQPANLKDPAFVEELRSLDADLFIVIAFRMLPEVVWRMPRLGTFNLHASLLPKYRGAAPINRAIMNGETETGVTTFFLKHEIDTGDIIDRRSIEIGPDENVGSVHDRLMMLGADMVVKTVNDIMSGNLQTQPQPEGEFVAAPKIFKDDCHIDLGLTARQIHNHVRGLSPYPAAWIETQDANGKELVLKVFATRVTDRKAGIGKPWIVEDKKLFLPSSDYYVEVLELQPSGKKRMTTAEFLRGYNLGL